MTKVKVRKFLKIGKFIYRKIYRIPTRNQKRKKVNYIVCNIAKDQFENLKTHWEQQ